MWNMAVQRTKSGYVRGINWKITFFGHINLEEYKCLAKSNNLLENITPISTYAIQISDSFIDIALTYYDLVF